MYGMSFGIVATVIEKAKDRGRELPNEDYQRMIPVVAMIFVLSVLELFFSFFSVFSYTIDSAAAAPTRRQVKHSTFYQQTLHFLESACESSSFSCSSYIGCNFLFSTLFL